MKDNNGNTPLSMAVQAGHDRYCTSLLLITLFAHTFPLVIEVKRKMFFSFLFSLIWHVVITVLYQFAHAFGLLNFGG